MLLLPITLATLSVLSAALLPAAAPDLGASQLPASRLVADIGYVAKVNASVDGDHPAETAQWNDADAGADRGDDVAVTEPPATDSGAMADDSGFGPAADPASLDGMRGGDGSSASSIVMNGNVADNRATNVVTGANTITAGAFANASGVPMVVQNTGANVLIQNATVINLQLR